jgi:hypothetical protein
MPGTLTPEDHDGLTAALLAAIEAKDAQRAADSAILEAAASRAKNLKAIASAVLFFGTLIGGGAITFKELQDKPTKKEVHTIAEEHVEPVRAEALKVEDVAGDVEEIREDVETVKSVQDYQIEQSAWQGDVLQHVAEKKRTKPPPKPESLKKKERELLRK